MPSDTNERTEPSRSHVKVFRLTLILASLTAFAPFATDMYLASFALLAESFRTDSGTVQLSLCVFFLGLALGQLLYGPLIDRVGRKRPLLIGVGLFVVTCSPAAPSVDMRVRHLETDDEEEQVHRGADCRRAA